MTRYGMAVDLNRCFGCHTCATACMIANNLPQDLMFLRVHTVGGEEIDTAAGTFPNCELSYMPVNCQHCQNALCVDVCPTGATSRGEDGIISVDGDLCIGCESCIKACPFEGIRTLLAVEPTYYLDLAVGEADAPIHKKGTVEKCTFCKNLIERNEVPACMQLCPGRARYWGDLDDPGSEVSKAIEGREHTFLDNNSGGTNPNIYYLRQKR